jgi:ELWxxDGT repeat protein
VARALFNGTDADDLQGLWVTDGTAAGTYEITGIADANTTFIPPLPDSPPGGFSPSDFAAFNGEVLFNGRNTANQWGLWVTNGTAAGTHEIIGITGAWVNGIDPVGLTAFNGTVLFDGVDADGVRGLWVTDGTAAGTHELTGIVNASASSFGFSPTDFTLFHDEVLFSGLNAANQSGLWVTDGTAAGTHEITGIAGASTPSFNPTAGASTPSFSPTGFTLFNGEVLFNGYDTAGQSGLWVTDGTAAGTHEITGVVGANPTYGLSPSFLTLFNGEVLFSGFDTANHFGLWVTDGTAGGTHELTGIADVLAAMASFGLNPTGFIAFNGKVLFNGTDTAYQSALWVTDGTAAGTHEITGIAGASLGPNGHNGFDPSEFEAFNGEVLFNGYDTAGQGGLWVTDGTAAGTHEITGISGANPTGGLQPLNTFAIGQLLTATPFDLNGDGLSDLVFQNNGQAGVWLMNGTTPIAEAGLGNPGASWHIITSRDVNGDGNADLIWQNNDGTPGIWLMNGTTPVAEAGFSNPGASWHIVLAGDFNRDGMADLLWQNTDGTLGVWLMNGTTPIAEAGIGNPGASWKVVDTADYNGDGRDDILLQNTATGNLMIDLMNGTSITSSVSISVGDPSWHAVSTGEFNGQGEIAWQNKDGAVGIWLMNGTAPVAQAGLSNPGAGWQLLSVDHFTPNGQADLLFQNTNGAMMLWEMNGTGLAAQVNLPNPGGWQSVNGHPFATG